MKVDKKRLRVREVRQLYKSGLKQREIGALLGVDQSTVSNFMTRKRIKTRPQGSGSQRGVNVRGDSSYYVEHHKVRSLFGTPSICFHCGCTQESLYDWANLTGRFDDPEDYVRLCRRDHNRMDLNLEMCPEGTCPDHP